MDRPLLFVVIPALLLVTGKSRADETTANAPAVAEAAVAETAVAETAVAETAVAETAPENTIAACTDGLDNDGDGFIDCADQDCRIFAVCVARPQSATAPVLVVSAERGRQCRDGIDNDENGKTDCHDPSCQGTNYCARVMYERPVPTDKAPGPFVTLSLGLALPNFNWSDIRTDSDFGDHLPFDPDTGTMAGLKIGMLPLPWLGGGVNLNFGGTFATNRYDMILIADNPDDYRYYGYKAFGHIGGFVRLQYPFRRVVPFIDIAAGYSAVRYRWTVYDASTSWSDIEEDWDSGRTDSSVDRDKRTVTDGHFTLALEPGVDVFVLERRFAVGARGWLPIVASSHRGMDNIGLMFTATFTPQWAEPLQRKQEYQQ